VKDTIAFEGEHHTEREKDVLTAGYYFLKDRMGSLLDVSGDQDEMLDEDSNASRFIPKTKSAFPNRNNDSFSTPLETVQTCHNARPDAYPSLKNIEKFQQELNSKISMKKLTLFQNMDKAELEKSKKTIPDEEITKTAREMLSKLGESFTPQKDANTHRASLQARKSIQSFVLPLGPEGEEEKIKKVQRLSSTEEDQTGYISNRYNAGSSNSLRTPFETKNTFNNLPK
jgi:hypothetical protein